MLEGRPWGFSCSLAGFVIIFRVESRLGPLGKSLERWQQKNHRSKAFMAAIGCGRQQREGIWCDLQLMAGNSLFLGGMWSAAQINDIGTGSFVGSKVVWPGLLLPLSGAWCMVFSRDLAVKVRVPEARAVSLCGFVQEDPSNADEILRQRDWGVY